MRKTSLLLILLSLATPILKAQNHKEVDSLKRLRNVAKADSIKIKLNIKIIDCFLFLNPDTALILANECEIFAQKAKDKKGLAECKQRKGTVYMLKANLTSAIGEFLPALGIAKDLKDLPLITKLNTNLGMVYARSNNFSEALRYYTESLKIAESLESSQQIAFNKLNISALYIDNKRFAEALKILLELDSTIEANETSLKLPILGNIMDCYTSLNQFDKAIISSIKLIELCEKSGNVKYIAQSYNATAKLYQSLKSYDKSILYFQKSLEMSRKLKDFEGIKWNAAGLIEVYNITKDYQNAFKYSQISADANDSILDELKTKEINRLQIKYEREQNEKDKTIAAQKVQKQELYTLFLGIGTCLLIVLVVVVFRSRQIEAKAKILLTEKNHEISEKNEELEQLNEEISEQRNYLEELNNELINKR